MLSYPVKALSGVSMANTVCIIRLLPLCHRLVFILVFSGYCIFGSDRSTSHHKDKEHPHRQMLMVYNCLRIMPWCGWIPMEGVSIHWFSVGEEINIMFWEIGSRSRSDFPVPFRDVRGANSIWWMCMIHLEQVQISIFSIHLTNSKHNMPLNLMSTNIEDYTLSQRVKLV